jgi:hypothetical protein
LLVLQQAFLACAGVLGAGPFFVFEQGEKSKKNFFWTLKIF